MRPEQKSVRLLGITRSKGKMYEYGLPEKQHININENPTRLFHISIALLGELAAAINRGEESPFSESELKKNLIFSAYFFDAYLQSKLNSAYDAYVLLLGAASYYLCDLPGSSSVLTQKLQNGEINLDAGGLENLLLFLLRGDWQIDIDENSTYGEHIAAVIGGVRQFFQNGTGEEKLLEFAVNLRREVYESGTPRQLLFADVTIAVLRSKIERSTWKTLPAYSGLTLDTWRSILQKDSFIKELWPAQHLLGKKGVLQGRSAVVQMPTSAGKTKSTELILRSAFLANRISLAVIIAPFRALCNEISGSLTAAFDGEAITVNELSDVLQIDYDNNDFTAKKTIMVATPEKMLYILRHEPALAQQIGLLIFDEGHQFDDETRGTTYELLLTELLSLTSKDTQKVLISAVLNNAETIGEWLNGEANVVEGANLFPTSKSVGYVSWIGTLGQIQYFGAHRFGQYDYFVPRVIRQVSLNKKGRERKQQIFPGQKDNASDIALYLGLKLVSSGAVAVFSGRKDSIYKLCDRFIDIIERGFSLPSGILEESETVEVQRLERLHRENLGSDAPAVKCAKYGIFTHHGNMPHGIRSAVEYAMQHNMIHFVICTSTLAQGVNLPIRYLIVANARQGKEIMRKPDFLNLIGRVGRAGMHTEGSIIFADPKIYDGRNNRTQKWRWEEVQNLLHEGSPEPCSSNIMMLFSPIVSKDQKYELSSYGLDFVQRYIDAESQDAFVDETLLPYSNIENFPVSDMKYLLLKRIDILHVLESFLLSHSYNMEKGMGEEDVLRLVKGTLVYFLADDEEKENIQKVFQLLFRNIVKEVPQPARRVVYGKSLFGLREVQQIEQWVQLHEKDLRAVEQSSEILDILWTLFSEYIHANEFKTFDPSDLLKAVGQRWIQGDSFGTILSFIQKYDVHIGMRRSKITINHVVGLCENILSYEGGLIVSAVCEFLEMMNSAQNNEAIQRLRLFQKQLKYGLTNQTMIILYELGISDRVIAQHLVEKLHLTGITKHTLMQELKEKTRSAADLMNKYPHYFQEQLKQHLEMV